MTDTQSFFETPSPPDLTGIRAWLLTHDHKRLGLMYMWTILFWFVLAMFFGLLMRTELMSQGRTIMGPEVYNSMFTLHGVIMIFLFGIPAIPAIFGNFFLPIQLGTDDVFFPRLNLFSWYLFMFGGLFAIVSLFCRRGISRYRLDLLCALQRLDRRQCLADRHRRLYPRHVVDADRPEFCHDLSSDAAIKKWA